LDCICWACFMSLFMFFTAVSSVAV